jgi:hypothetical protein
MTLLDPELVETLLHMNESNVLDFKQAQYPFANVSDEVKSELVKDILAFANAWKTADAHIVIGAADGHGTRAVVHGIAEHLDDANLQQLVNTKTNRPVAFQYLATTVEGKKLAVIRIAKDQQRPIFLIRRFGKLEPNEVYIRRGSSTTRATPDEIAKMGEARVAATAEPELQLSLGHPDTHELFVLPHRVTSRVLVDPPRDEHLDAIAGIKAATSDESLNMYGRDPAKVTEHRRYVALLTPLAFAVQNIGRVLVEDVTVRVDLPSQHGLVLVDELPEHPGELFVPRHGFRPGRPTTIVKQRGKVHELVAKVGKVQTDATAWSEPFWIGSSVTRVVTLQARVGADGLAKPVRTDIELRLTARRVFDGEHAEDADPDPDD